MLINLRGEYLQTLGIGKNYLDVFWKNTKFKLGIGICNFLVLYILTYIITRFIKRGLKKFFDSKNQKIIEKNKNIYVKIFS